MVRALEKVNKIGYGNNNNSNVSANNGNLSSRNILVKPRALSVDRAPKVSNSRGYDRGERV